MARKRRSPVHKPVYTDMRWDPNKSPPVRVDDIAASADEMRVDTSFGVDAFRTMCAFSFGFGVALFQEMIRGQFRK